MVKQGSWHVGYPDPEVREHCRRGAAARGITIAEFIGRLVELHKLTLRKSEQETYQEQVAEQLAREVGLGPLEGV